MTDSMPDTISPYPPQPSQKRGARFRRRHCRALRQGQLRRRLVVARRLGPLGSRRQQHADQALQRVGRQEQLRGQDRLHHLAGREGQVDRGRRSASRHRPRHHVASRLEHPHSSERARAARRRRRRPDQAIRPDQPGRRISRQDQRHAGAAFRPRSAARSSRAARASISTSSMPASTCATCSRPTSRNGTRPRSIPGTGTRISRPLKSSTRPASRSACRWGRSSDAVDWVGALFNSFGVVMVDAKDNIKINSDETRDGAGIPEEADGGEPAGGLRLGRCRQQPLADFRQGLKHHEPAERLGGRQARQSDRGGELLDPSDAEGPEGPLRRPTAAVLRRVELSRRTSRRRKNF